MTPTPVPLLIDSSRAAMAVWLLCGLGTILLIGLIAVGIVLLGRARRKNDR